MTAVTSAAVSRRDLIGSAKRAGVKVWIVVNAAEIVVNAPDVPGANWISALGRPDHDFYPTFTVTARL